MNNNKAKAQKHRNTKGQFTAAHNEAKTMEEKIKRAVQHQNSVFACAEAVLKVIHEHGLYERKSEVFATIKASEVIAIY